MRPCKAKVSGKRRPEWHSRTCLKYFLREPDRLRSNYIPQQKRCARQAKVSEKDLAKASPGKRGSQGVLNRKMASCGVHTMSITSLRSSNIFILLTMFLNSCTR